MKALPYLNLPTHMGSWAGVMLEGDKLNCLHGLYLKLHLTLHAFRTNISHEPWLTLYDTLLCFRWP
jgi:hypothetical protein